MIGKEKFRCIVFVVVMMILSGGASSCGPRTNTEPLPSEKKAGDNKQPDKVGKLINQLKDEDSYVRHAAVQALGKFKDPRAVEPLLAALKGRETFFRNEVADALCGIKDPRAAELLIAALKDEDSDVREAAAYALKKIKDPHTVEPLITALKYEYSDVREGAAVTLGEIKDPRAVEPLIAALKDENWVVCGAAAHALAKIKDPRAVEPLLAAMKDNNGYSRSRAAEAAVYALGETKDPRAVDPLIAVLKDEEWIVRHAAAKSLGEINDKSVISILVPYLRDWEVGGAVGDSLKNFGWQPESIEDKVHYFIAQRNKDELIQIWETTKAVLLKDVESGEYLVIENALYAFIGFGKSEIIPELIDKLNKKGTKVMAETYLNCGQVDLRQAAEAWASAHGYHISSGSGANPVSWGSM